MEVLEGKGAMRRVSPEERETQQRVDMSPGWNRAIGASEEQVETLSLTQ